jgi:hypothetical protein
MIDPQAPLVKEKYNKTTPKKEQTWVYYNPPILLNTTLTREQKDLPGKY